MENQNLDNEIINKIRTLQAEIEQIQISIDAIEQQLSLVKSAMGTLQDAMKAQKELETKSPGDEILLPIGGANLVKCRVDNPKEIYVSLGSGISLLTDIKDSQNRTNQQIENLERNYKQLQEQHSQFSKLLEQRRENLVKIAQDHGIIQ
ncbi:MAG: prefoldin subunit alpha [Candidatus Hodarchaeales archaeon]